jgi:hypothetical protein
MHQLLLVIKIHLEIKEKESLNHDRTRGDMRFRQGESDILCTGVLNIDGEICMQVFLKKY